MNEGRFEEAAEEYARLAAEYADNPETAPLGLYNSGLIYEQNLRRYERAMEQFNNLVRTYPESEWVDPSLVRIAVNAKKFFDFEQAIATFQTLDERGFSDAALVEYPILDAAELLEYSQRYEEAARGYIEFVDRYPSDSRASGVLYKAGTLYGLAGMDAQMLSTFERFRREYGQSASTALIDIDAAYIDTLYRAAKYYEEQGDSRNAQRFFAQVVTEFDIRQPEAAEAKYAAAEVLYNRAMAAYQTWAAIQLGTTVSQQRAGITRRTDGIPPVLQAFDTVSTYGSADWTVCAFYMRGQVYQDFADLLIGLPMPDFGGNLDAEDEYMIMLTDLTTPIEDAAIREWEIAYPVMQQLGVTNQCTLDTTRQLNRVRGDQYPLQQQPIVHEERRLFTPQVIARPPAAEVAPEGPTAGPTEDPFGEDL
jgi:TolA-binding protein